MEHFESVDVVNKNLACMLFIISLICISETVSLPLDAVDGEHLSGSFGRAKRVLPIYDVKSNNHCPPPGYETERNRDYYSCTAPYQYHCRLNKNTDYVDGCAIPKICTIGTEAVLYVISNDKYEVRCDKCRDGYFNDDVLHSSLNDTKCEKMRYCVYEKMICVNGTPSSDNQCTCNYKEDYKPRALPLNQTSCTPNCVYVKCPDMHYLDGPPSYECLPKEGYITTKSTTTSGPQGNQTVVDTSKAAINTSVISELTSPQTTRHDEATKHPNGTSGGLEAKDIIIIALIGVIGVVCLIVGVICYRKRRVKDCERRENISSRSSEVVDLNDPIASSSADNGAIASANGTELVELNDPIPSPSAVNGAIASANGTGRPPSGSTSSHVDTEYRNKTWLDEYPDRCSVIEYKEHEKLLKDLDPDVFIDQYKVEYGDDLQHGEENLIRRIDELKSIRANSERNRIIVTLAYEYGVDIYYRFKSCLPKHLKDEVDKREDIICTSQETSLTRTSQGPSLTGTSQETSLARTSQETSLKGTSQESSLTGTSQASSLTGTSQEPSSAGTSQETSLTGTSQEPSLARTSQGPSLTGTSQEPSLVESNLVASDKTEPTESDSLLQNN